MNCPLLRIVLISHGAMGTFETGLKLAALLISMSVNIGHKGFASIFGAASTDSFLESGAFFVQKYLKTSCQGRPPTAYPTPTMLVFLSVPLVDLHFHGYPLKKEDVGKLRVLGGVGGVKAASDTEKSQHFFLGLVMAIVILVVITPDEGANVCSTGLLKDTDPTAVALIITDRLCSGDPAIQCCLNYSFPLCERDKNKDCPPLLLQDTQGFSPSALQTLGAGHFCVEELFSPCRMFSIAPGSATRY